MRLSRPCNERRNIQPVDQYRVVVGEVGIAFDGDSRSEATGQFDQFVIRSKTMRFAMAGKSIALFKDYEILKEYHPPDPECDF